MVPVHVPYRIPHGIHGTELVNGCIGLLAEMRLRLACTRNRYPGRPVMCGWAGGVGRHG